MSQIATASGERPAPTELSEVVFVYGSLRKKGIEAYRMEGARWEGEGEIGGELFAIDGNPAWQHRPSSAWVKGELFQISPAHLLELDSRGEAKEWGAGASGGYRRVRVKVYHIASSRFLGEAWVWEWTGSTERARRIESGDWIEVELPPPVSWYTQMAGLLLLGFVAAIVVLMSDLHPFQRKPVLEMMLGLLAVVPMIAGIMAYWGIRRREAARASARWILAASLVLSIPTGMALASAISAWFVR